MAVTPGESSRGSASSKVMGTAGQAFADLDLLRGVQKGSEAALREILARYQGRVYGLALRMLRSPQDAEEALQDVALTLFRKAGTFQGKAAVSSWIYRITMNACLMKLRRRPKVAAIPLEEELGPEMNEEGMTLVPIADWSGVPRDELQRKELLARIQAAAQELPPEYRVVFVLRDMEGLSAEEARQILGLSLPALKSRLHRARLFLRKHLAEYVEGRTGASSDKVTGRPDAHLP